MIISEKIKKINCCKSENPLEDIFENLNQRKKKHNMANGVPIYFCRLVGVDEKQEYDELLVKVVNRIKSLSEIGYVIISKGMDKNLLQEEVEDLANIWLDFKSWYDDKSRKEFDLYKLEFEDRSGLFDWEYKKNLVKILEIFDSKEKSTSDTIRKNFILLLMFWSKRYLLKLLLKVKAEGGAHIPKILYYGQLKRNEAYFLIFASFFGCDVVYINPEEDNELSRIDPFNKFSSIKYFRNRASLESINNPFLYENISMKRNENIKQVKKTPSATSIATGSTLAAAAAEAATVTATATAALNAGEILLETIKPIQREGKLEQERSYEELAALSASIVMVNIYRHDFFPGGIGSGVVIDGNGLILTNYHVVKEGGIFGIVFENDEHEYISHKLLDYNVQSDLALIRIDLKTTPIPIRSQNKLNRGQQIVAIGSPLGLMNTISDGIIAGFRKTNELEYIQITAPISPGSSGGALIDKYGYLIGITTAGFSDGQNLNLAVPIGELSKLRNSNLK